MQFGPAVGPPDSGVNLVVRTAAEIVVGLVVGPVEAEMRVLKQIFQSNVGSVGRQYPRQHFLF